MSKVFLSHSSKDKFIVRKVASRLRAFGVEIWIDEAELNIGDSLTDKIGEAIDDSDYVCVFLSNNSIESEWVQQELKIAMNREMQEKNVVVLPILLDKVDIPPFLRDKLYADFTSEDMYETSFKQLLKVFSKNIEVIESKSLTESTASVQVENVKVHKMPKSATEKRFYEFEDLKMIGINNNRSYKPDHVKALYNIYIELSQNPSSEWKQIFEAERRFPRHTMWRRAWIENGSIVIHCVPEEMGKYHLKDLKEDVQNTNIRYREYLSGLLKKEQQVERRQKEEEQRFNDLMGGLDFR